MFVVKWSSLTGSHDLFVFVRESLMEDWSTPSHLGTRLNSPHVEQSPVFDPREKALFFTSNPPGGHGGFDIWRTRRMKKTH